MMCGSDSGWLTVQTAEETSTQRRFPPSGNIRGCAWLQAYEVDYGQALV